MINIEYKICSSCKKLKEDNEFENCYIVGRKELKISICKNCGNKSKSKKDRAIKSYLKIRFKITIEQYNELFANQNGCCAICGTHQSNLKHRLCVDHDHKTEKLRSLLCTNCNVGLGNFKDNIQFLKFAIIYLENHRG